jgi:hypothetical protein
MRFTPRRGFRALHLPNSSTDSVQRDGDLSYATVDLGFYIFDSERAKIGGFVGYNWLHQTVNAFGCEQTTSSFICDPPIPNFGAGDHAGERLALRSASALNGEVAWGSIGRSPVRARGCARLPGRLRTHWLRICPDFGCFTGPLPEDGDGDGYQLEGILQYRPTDRVSLGLGGRYWHMETSGDTHFEGRVVVSTPPLNRWTGRSISTACWRRQKFGSSRAVDGEVAKFLQKTHRVYVDCDGDAAAFPRHPGEPSAQPVMQAPDRPRLRQKAKAVAAAEHGKGRLRRAEQPAPPPPAAPPSPSRARALPPCGDQRR